MRPTLKAVILAANLVSLPAWGAFWTGQKLVEMMRHDERFVAGQADAAFGAGSFFGYVIGIHDALDRRRRICTPNGVKVDQIVAVASKYLKDHPEKWNEPASDVVTVALGEAFPCPATRR
jgi:hypothetical protein